METNHQATRMTLAGSMIGSRQGKRYWDLGGLSVGQKTLRKVRGDNVDADASEEFEKTKTVVALGLVATMLDGSKWREYMNPGDVLGRGER
jgi:hypothetical protein